MSATLLDNGICGGSAGCSRSFDPASGRLVLRPRGRSLSYAELAAMIEGIRFADLSSVDRIIWDFSNVGELVGPFGLHWAVLTELERCRWVPVRVIHLQGEVAESAWLFAGSPDVAALLEDEAARLADERRAAESPARALAA